MPSNITPSGEWKVSETLSGVADLYTQSLSDHGLTSKSVGWKDAASQRLRFEKLAQVIDLQTAGEGITVNDVGCGYGAMFRFLEAMPGVRLTRYYGYDISQEMLATAKQYITDVRAEFIRSSRVLHEADYSFVSGTFNVKLGENEESWVEYIQEMLVALSAKSTRGFAFNLLTTYVDWKQDNLYYADPFIFFDFCKRRISRYVSLLHDYPLYEWTMIVRQEAYPG